MATLSSKLHPSGLATTNTQTVAVWEAGTSTTETIVSPEKIKGAIVANSTSKNEAEAFVIYSGTTPSFLANSGFSSVSRSAAGQTVYTFTNAEANTNYIVDISIQTVLAGDNRNNSTVSSKSTTGFTTLTTNVHSNGTDHDQAVVVRRI